MTADEAMVGYQKEIWKYSIASVYLVVIILVNLSKNKKSSFPPENLYYLGRDTCSVSIESI